MLARWTAILVLSDHLVRLANVKQEEALMRSWYYRNCDEIACNTFFWTLEGWNRDKINKPDTFIKWWTWCSIDLMVALIISEIELQIRCQNYCKKSLFDSLLVKFSRRVMLSNTKKDEQRNMQRHCRGKILAVGGNSSPLSYVYINPLCLGVRYFPAFYFLE